MWGMDSAISRKSASVWSAEIDATVVMVVPAKPGSLMFGSPAETNNETDS